MRRTQLVGVLTVIAALVAAPAVRAADPDDSAIDQYTENVPGAGGENPANGGGGGGGSEGSAGNSGASLSADAAGELQAAGGDGEAAADLAQATAPPEGTAPTGSSGDGGPAHAGSRDAESAAGTNSSASDGGIDSTVDNLVSGSSDSGGMGMAFPIILGASLLLAVAFVLLRRRGHGEPGNA